ncbi:helicase-associated domain-containing protein [Saccharopolyspora elongata]|uniref:WYL domain-containing protein n=1 Tax=Saccharopolyspora elongata TaxID=2530387 RepID=A0A4R4Z1D9_9PSEU|nr:helicase-associated domain-containing protein [Saccharopolyspora elongata]TDD51170.1 WYL domain-containing protein [Saccharopolyspora elongata]
MDSDFVQWLRDLGRDDLAALLKNRPESVVAGAHSLSRLAAVLDSPGAVESALQRLDAGCHEVLRALCGLGDGCTREMVEEVLGAGPELDRALRVLQEHVLIRPDPQGAIRLAAPLRHAHTAGLGRPVAKLLHPHVSNTVRGIAETLGLEPARRKADTIRRIEEFMQDPAKVSAEFAKAPSSAVELAVELARDDSVFRSSFGSPSPQSPGVRWLLNRGFLISPNQYTSYSGPFEMPREIGLALREHGNQPVLRPEPPMPPTTTIDPIEVDKAAALAATGFADGVARLLEHCAVNPLAMLQNGGVGVRVLKQLAKALGTDQHEIRLWLETAAAAELLSLDGAGCLVPSNLADDWQRSTPAQRYAWLVRAWWEQPAAAMFSKVVDKPGPAMLPRTSAFDRRLRADLVAELSGWEPGAALDEPNLIGERLAWKRPMLYCCAADLVEPIQVNWDEAEAVGAIARGALSTLGRCGSDAEALLAAAVRLLPEAQETALLQADLSAVVAGTPSGRLAATLNLMADQEGRDTASTWRFSPESVRRAMDRGHSAEDLLGKLAEIARADLPQPLEYLIKDVERRFGQLQVRTVQCCVLGEEALLREVSRNRALRELSLQVLAPTVLASSKPAQETLAALRKAGYAPVPQAGDGTVVVERAAADDRPPVVVAQPYYLDFAPEPLMDAEVDELAERLLSQPDEVSSRRAAPLVQPPTPNSLDDMAVMFGDLGRVLAERTAGLSDLEVELLTEAVEGGTDVEIEYRDQNDSSTTRVITPYFVAGNHLDAYCHLREDDRQFRLDRIRAVSPLNRRRRAKR